LEHSPLAVRFLFGKGGLDLACLLFPAAQILAQFGGQTFLAGRFRLFTHAKRLAAIAAKSQA
jgi:hypothetical protein